MMQTIEIKMPTAATSGKTVYLPLKDRCRLISALVGIESTVTTGQLEIGKGDKHVLVADLDDKTAGDVVAATLDTANSTEAELNQIFGPNEPVKIKGVTNATTAVTIQLTVDPFLIGKHHGLST